MTMEKHCFLVGLYHKLSHSKPTGAPKCIRSSWNPALWDGHPARAPNFIRVNCWSAGKKHEKKRLSSTITHLPWAGRWVFTNFGGPLRLFSELRQLLLRRVFFRPFQTFPELPGCLLSYSKNIQNNFILFFFSSPLCRIRIGRQSHHSPYVRPVISEECQNFMTRPTPPLYVRSQHLTTGFTNQKATTWPDQKYLPIQIPEVEELIVVGCWHNLREISTHSMGCNYWISKLFPQQNSHLSVAHSFSMSCLQKSPVEARPR